MTKKEQNEQNRTIRDAAADSIRSRASWLSAQRERFERYVGRFEVLLAVDLDRGATAVAALPRGDWRKWAKEVLPDRDEKTVYRWRNAGRVAAILIGDGTDERPNLLGDIPAASIGHLVPFYRVLPTGKAATAEAVAAAEDLIRSTWATLCEDLDDEEVTLEDGETVAIVAIPPTIAAATEAANAVAPTNRSGGGSSKEKEEDGEDGDGTADRGETPVQVDPAAVEAATGPTVAIVKQCAGENNLDPAAVAGIMLAALRLAAEHGISTVQAVLASGTMATPADVDPEPSAEDVATAEAAATVAA